MHLVSAAGGGDREDDDKGSTRKKEDEKTERCSLRTAHVLAPPLLLHHLSSELRAARRNTEHTDADKQGDAYAYFLLAAALRTF